MKKDNKNFDVENGMALRICNLYDNIMKEISKLMFQYGVNHEKI